MIGYEFSIVGTREEKYLKGTYGSVLNMENLKEILAKSNGIRRAAFVHLRFILASIGMDTKNMREGEGELMFCGQDMVAGQPMVLTYGEPNRNMERYPTLMSWVAAKIGNNEKGEHDIMVAVHKGQFASFNPNMACFTFSSQLEALSLSQKTKASMNNAIREKMLESILKGEVEI